MTGAGRNGDGRYMYCIVRCADPHQFNTLGIGERGDVVHTVSYDGLAAVVSDSPVVEYESNRRNMMSHTLVLEEAMRAFTILPVRFGTVGSSDEDIRERVLKRRYGELHGLINQMQGKVELGLKAFWYEDAVFKEILAENRLIRQSRDRLAGKRPEETYYERIRLGEMIEKAMWDKRARDSETILERLRPLALECRTNQTTTDRMVVNSAFLVEAARQPEFDQAVQELDRDIGKRFVFKYVGPVPPYNFVNIVIKWNE